MNDLVNDDIEALEDVMVFNTQYRPAEFLKAAVTTRILATTPGVRLAIHFDDKPNLGAGEVHDVRADDELTTEGEARLGTGELTPEPLLRPRGLEAHLPGALLEEPSLCSGYERATEHGDLRLSVSGAGARRAEIQSENCVTRASFKTHVASPARWRAARNSRGRSAARSRAAHAAGNRSEVATPTTLAIVDEHPILAVRAATSSPVRAQARSAEHGQGGGGAAKPRREGAHLQEGVQLADAGKHEEARLKFQQAASVLKAAAVMYNLARAEQLTGHDFEAIEHYRQFLRFAEHDGTIKDAQRADARKFIADLTPKVGQVDVEAPPSARVSIDGKALEESPPKGPVAVQPGRHTIEAAFEGKLKSISVECEAGRVTKAKIEFESGTTEPPPAGGSGPGWSTARIVTVAGLGVGAAVGVTIGVLFAGASRSAKTESEDIRSKHLGLCAYSNDSNCVAYDAKRSDAKTDAAIAYVGYIAGGVFAAGAIAASIVWPKSAEQARTRPSVTPLISPNACGAAVSAAF